MQLTNEYKARVIDALLAERNNYDGSDSAFAKSKGISSTIYSRLKGGERDRLLSEMQWLTLGRNLGVVMNQRKWNVAKTEVFATVEEDVLFCKEYSKARIIADDSGIGKTFAAQYLSRTQKNCFHIDCKQAKTKHAFIRLLAKKIGIDDHGRFIDVKNNIKYYLQILTKPVIIADDAGYLEYNAYMEMLELVDATEGICGWYQIGDDSLQELIRRGIEGKKVGFRAMFSRFSKRYTTVVPLDHTEKVKFYKKLIRSVVTANAAPGLNIDLMVNKCLLSDDKSVLGDLRRAESLLLLENA